MNSANEITEELKDMGSMLAGLSRAMPYSVPVGYFDECDERAALARKTPVWNKTMPHTVPSGYFEGLAGNVMAAVHSEQSAEPELSYSKAMPYHVPAGYFEALPIQMRHAALRAAPMKKTATIIPLRNTFKQVRWAAAAVLLVCIGFGGYISFFSGGPQSGTEVMLASVPNEEIHDYLQHSYLLYVDQVLNNTDINKIQVDSKDIIQYLNETGWDVVD